MSHKLLQTEVIGDRRSEWHVNQFLSKLDFDESPELEYFHGGSKNLVKVGPF